MDASSTASALGAESGEAENTKMSREKDDGGRKSGVVWEGDGL